MERDELVFCVEDDVPREVREPKCPSCDSRRWAENLEKTKKIRIKYPKERDIIPIADIETNESRYGGD